MPAELKWIFLAALVLFGMQAFGSWLQIQDYKKAVRRVHRLGSVGVGQQKGFGGKLVLVACDSCGFITGAETMEGITIFARFRPRSQAFGHTLEGAHIEDLLSELRALEPKRRKRLKGWLQALEALESRLYPEADPDADEGST